MPCAPIENTSANCARDDLNPAVLTFATLLAVTLRSAEAAFSPLRAMRNGMVYSVTGKVDGQSNTSRTASKPYAPRPPRFSVSPSPARPSDTLETGAAAKVSSAVAAPLTTASACTM